MVKTAEKPWIDVIVAEERANAAKEADMTARAEERARAARDKASLLKLLAQPHPDIAPTVEAAEAKLAELGRHDE